LKKTKFTEVQIVFALHPAETGVTVPEDGHQQGHFYYWKKKFGGVGVTELRRLKHLEEESQPLKQLVADLRLDKQLRQVVLKQSSEARAARHAAQHLIHAYRICARRACRVIGLQRELIF